MTQRTSRLAFAAMALFFMASAVGAQDKPEIPAGSVVVMRMAVCRDIKNYLPDQEVTQAKVGEIVVGWTQIRSGLGPITIEHRWLCGNDLMGASILKVKTSPFKTWSRRPLTRPGHWRLQVVDPAGNVLQERAFEVTR